MNNVLEKIEQRVRLSLSNKLDDYKETSEKEDLKYYVIYKYMVKDIQEVDMKER